MLQRGEIAETIARWIRKKGFARRGIEPRGSKGNDRSKPTLPTLADSLAELEAKHRKVGNTDYYVWLVKSWRRLLFIFSR